MEQAKTKRESFISIPLLKQTIKANWMLWLMLTIGSAAIFFVINVVVTSKNIFTNINIDNVSIYVKDEGLSWFQILGLMEQMGYSLSRIAVMSRVDLNSIISDLVYKIAGVLLPMIYVMITSNALIADQVSSGSLAYVLSTPTSRRKVIRTSYLFLIGSLFAMYLVITGVALGSETIAGAIRIANGGASNMYPVRTLLLCLSSFCALFALSGICFGASAFFNKTNYSIAVGGGVCVLSFLCVILGLFGNTVFVSVGVGVQAMSVFNYGTVFTLIDTDSIGAFAKALAGVDGVTISYNWIWEIGVLVAIGIVGALVGSIRFLKKDLPL
ncbi:MAG: ABC transporter permease [Bacilli bacterium]|nr:ABC transporter permease [Bacilli bacterium]